MVKRCPTHLGSCFPFVKRTWRCYGKVLTDLQVSYSRFIMKQAGKKWSAYPILHRTLSICVSRDSWEGSDRFFQHCNSRATVRPRASSFATRDACRTSASVSSSRNRNTHLDKVRNQYKGGVGDPRVEVSKSLLHLHDYWLDKALLFL